MKKLLIIVGLPGSGKDTQIEALAERRKLTVIRVGDLVREKAKNDERVARDLKEGNLADDAMVNELIASEINNAGAADYLVSDGFPRDLDQAKWLDDFLRKNNVELDKVMFIKVDDAVALERLLKRGRDDDNEATIKHRVGVFHRQTDEVVEYYQNSGKLVEIDGNGTPTEVIEDIKAELGW